MPQDPAVVLVIDEDSLTLTGVATTLGMAGYECHGARDAEAAFKACTNAVKSHGGMGYAKEFHVERLLREAMIPVLAPVSQQMILNFIAERVLGLPRSY